MGDEGVAAPLRHPDSDPLTQITASPGPPLTAPPPLLGSLRGTTTATRSPPLPPRVHITRPALRTTLFEDMSAANSSMEEVMNKYIERGKHIAKHTI